MESGMRLCCDECFGQEGGGEHSKDICVVMYLKVPNGVCDQPLNFSWQEEALTPTIRNHLCVMYSYKSKLNVYI